RNVTGVQTCALPIYAPRSAEANAVLHRIQELSHHVRELPHVIGGQRRMTEETWDVAAPHDHQNVIARMATADEQSVQDAIDAALAVQDQWAAMPWWHRAAIFLR